MKVNFIIGVLLKLLGTVVSLGGKNSRVVILNYHRVLPEQDVFRQGDISRNDFEWQMEILKDYFNVLPLSEAMMRFGKGNLPSRCVCITFDDGYADNYEVALPILKKWGLPATIFVAVGFLDGGRMWNDTVIESICRTKGSMLDLREIGLGSYSICSLKDRICAIDKLLNKLKYLPIDERANKVEKVAEIVGEALPTDLMLTTEQLKKLYEEGVEVGAHTVNHPILSQMSDKMAEQEVLESRDRLRDILDVEITSFAYPNGHPDTDYNASHIKILKNAGFKISVSTVPGSVGVGTDFFQLPRISAWARTPLRFVLQILQAYLQR